MSEVCVVTVVWDYWNCFLQWDVFCK